MAFLDDLDAFLGALGVENGDLAWYCAQIPFQSVEHRDAFISEVTR